MQSTPLYDEASSRNQRKRPCDAHVAKPSIALNPALNPDPKFPSNLLDSLAKVNNLLLLPLFEERAKAQAELNYGLKRNWWGMVCASLIRRDDIHVRIIRLAEDIGLLPPGRPF